VLLRPQTSVRDSPRDYNRARLKEILGRGRALLLHAGAVAFGTAPFALLVVDVAFFFNHRDFAFLARHEMQSPWN
jgi:hypothetical protein